MSDVLDRVTPLVGELADKLTDLVQELVREGIRARFRAVLETELETQPALAKTKKAKAKAAKPARGGASHVGGHACGLCQKPGHNRKTCPDREDAEPTAAPAVIDQGLRNVADRSAIERDLKPKPPKVEPPPPRASKPVDLKPPPPVASGKSDRFSRIQAAARARSGADE